MHCDGMEMYQHACKLGCEQATRFALRLRPYRQLDQGQESGSAGGQTRGGGGLGQNTMAEARAARVAFRLIGVEACPNDSTTTPRPKIKSARAAMPNNSHMELSLA